MARHHRQGTTQPGAAAPAAAGAAGEATAAPPLSTGWQIALIVWGLGLGGLMLYELVGFLIRAVRGPG